MVGDVTVDPTIENVSLAYVPPALASTLVATSTGRRVLSEPPVFPLARASAQFVIDADEEVSANSQLCSPVDGSTMLVAVSSARAIIY